METESEKNVSVINPFNNVSMVKIGILIVLAIFVLGMFLAIFVYRSNIDKAIKVNITMTEYYGSIEYILEELGLDFDLVTMGANCYTGVQKNEFKTEKYGVLYTEFRYCKSNETTIFRVYNSSKDQKLREPKENELPKFNSYGRPTYSY